MYLKQNERKIGIQYVIVNWKKKKTNLIGTVKISSQSTSLFYHVRDIISPIHFHQSLNIFVL